MVAYERQGTTTSGEEIRYNDEENQIKEVAENSGVKSAERNDIIGIRCLTYFEDSLLSKDAEKLYRVLRDNRIFRSSDDVYVRTTKYLTNKYPISMANYSNPEQARSYPKERVIDVAKKASTFIRSSTQEIRASVRSAYNSLTSPGGASNTQQTLRRTPSPDIERGEMGTHQE